jgi:hypothetical protein
VHPQDLIHCKDTLNAGLSVAKLKAPKRKNLERPTLPELDHDQDLRLSFALNDPKRSLRPMREATEGEEERKANDASLLRSTRENERTANDIRSL